MSEYKSRINVRVRIDQQDWKKLADIKTKEEWKLDESVEEIFIIARGGFIKTDDWSVDPKTLEDLVKTFAEIAGYEKCVIIADVVEQNVENPSGTSFLLISYFQELFFHCFNTGETYLSVFYISFAVNNEVGRNT